MRAFNASKVSLEDYCYRIFIYGPWGSGKTWFCGTMPSPVIICAAEDPGVVGLIAAGKDIEIIVIEAWNEIPAILADIKFGRKFADRKTICIDGLSNLTGLLVDKVLAPASGVKTTKKGRMTKEGWGIAVDDLRMAMKDFTDLHLLGKHVVLTSQSLMVKDEVQGGVYGLPVTIGKYAFSVPGFFDIVFFAEQDLQWSEGHQYPVFKFYTIKLGEFPAKDRFGKLDMIERNEWPAIYEKLTTRKQRVIPDFGPLFTAPPQSTVASGDQE